MRAPAWSMAAVVLVLAMRALAEPPEASQAPPASEKPAAGTPATAPRAQSNKVVVIADLYADETENARLRARVYDTARERGYEPDPGLDVIEAARNANVLERERVSENPALLGRLRAAVGASAMVRIARETQRGQKLILRVTVVTERGSDARRIEAAAADPAPAVQSVVGELLGRLATGAVESPGVAKSGGYLVHPGRPGMSEEARSVGPAALRQSWEQRGGLRASYEARLLLTGLLDPKVAFSDQNPVTGEIEPGEVKQWGVGGGVGVRLSMMYLSLPDPAAPTATWGGFRLGVGADGVVLYSRKPIGWSYAEGAAGRSVEYDNRPLFYPWISGQLGVHLGIGSYRTPTLWRGVVLGVAYSPAYVMSLDVGNGDFDRGGFNYAGVEATLDFAALEVDPGAGNPSKPQPRAFALLLPRIGDELPWLLSIGIGAAWY